MDISFQNAARTPSFGMVSQSGAGPQPGLAPIAGILTAPAIVVLGASIMRDTFGDNFTVPASVQAYAQTAGFTGTLHTRAEGGNTIADTRTRLAEVRALPDVAATQGQNLYLVHTGGNNVSSNRPYPGGTAEFTADYTTLMQEITATDAVVPLPLTKRLYTGPDAVIHGDQASEANGSEPYNENIIYPAIDQFAPDWRAAGQVPYVNPYALVDRYPQLLRDQVHGYSHSLSRYILARLSARARGQSPGQSRAGTSYFYSVGKGTPDNSVIGPINRLLSKIADFDGHPLLCGAVTHSGTYDPFIEVAAFGGLRGRYNYPDTAIYSRIADSRFHTPEFFDNGIYVQYDMVHQMVFSHLTPGDTLQVTAVGGRASTGTNRRATVALSTGETQELDGAQSAASNQVTFAPVTVPASGSVTFSISVAPGSTYGYLHGIALDFL